MACLAFTKDLEFISITYPNKGEPLIFVTFPFELIANGSVYL
jgi:hypothetical protein